MTQLPRRPDPQQPRSNQQRQTDNQDGSGQRRQINTQASTGQYIDSSEQNIKYALNGLKHLKEYPIRDMVKHAEAFGKYLKQQGLETNQIRKFLDAVNRIKVRLIGVNLTGDEEKDFSKIQTEVVLLQPKLAYAAGRKETSRPLKPFSKVIATAIDKVHSLEDFARLVQLIESIIAYHKAEGGK